MRLAASWSFMTRHTMRHWTGWRCELRAAGDGQHAACSTLHAPYLEGVQHPPGSPPSPSTPAQEEDQRARYFHFRKHRAELNWQHLHSADLEAIVANTDVGQLDKVRHTWGPSDDPAAASICSAAVDHEAPHACSWRGQLRLPGPATAPMVVTGAAQPDVWVHRRGGPGGAHAPPLCTPHPAGPGGNSGCGRRLLVSTGVPVEQAGQAGQQA
jgi:hypothetical protein